jgi:predicted dienelactone hydrolase
MRFALLFAPLFALTACNGDGEDTDVEPEISGVGHFESEADGPEGLTLPLSIWYPANPAESDELASYAFGLNGSAYADAPAADGVFPIIVVSHGNGGARHAGATIYEQWAEGGYVVVSMDHVGNTYTDSPSASEWVDIYVRRPGDIGASYQAAIALADGDDSPISGIVDADTVILAGHSTGGASVVLASGATLNTATVLAACGSGQLAGGACDIADDTDGDTISLAPTGMPTPVANITMAPLNSPLFSSSLDMGGATLVIVGTNDDVTPAGTNANPMYDDMPSPKALVTLQGANHYVFATVCSIPGLGALLPDVADQCVDDAYMSEDDAVAASGQIGLEFLDVHVKAKADADVDAAASGFDVTFESE